MKKTLVLLFLCACGAAQVVAPAVPLTPQSLYPTGEGSVWTYDVDTGVDEPPTFAKVQVESVTGVSVVIRVNDTRDTTYEVRREGIYRPDRDIWLLRTPIEVGTEWPSLSGRTARITAIDASLETPAGRFDRCVRVEETGGEAGRHLSTTYCPEVGVVEMRSAMTMELTGETIELVSHLRAFILSDPPSE